MPIANAARSMDVSFDVRQGAFAVLLGLNGAGKTTLFSLITQLYAAQHGSISVLGFDVAREPAQALSRLGVVFQARTLDLDLTVMQNLLYHASLHGIGGREGRALADETLARTEMPSVPTRKRACFPAGRCAVSRSPARCCTGRRYCCSTSRQSGSMSTRGKAF